MRKDFLLQKEAATRIQSAVRCFKCFNAFHGYTNAAITIQRFAKGWIVRKRLLGKSYLFRSFNIFISFCLFWCYWHWTHRIVCNKGVLCLEEDSRSGSNHDEPKDCNDGHELKMYAHSVLKLQRWWRDVLLTRSLRRTRSAILIQSTVRRWIVKKITSQRRHCIEVIQVSNITFVHSFIMSNEKWKKWILFTVILERIYRAKTFTRKSIGNTFEIAKSCCKCRRWNATYKQTYCSTCGTEKHEEC